MASPAPPFQLLQSPPPEATPFRGTATLPNGVQCEYYMAHSEKVAATKIKFLEDGPDNLIVISDFDRTISRARFIGMLPCDTGASIF